jgi:hypothetical protein
MELSDEFNIDIGRLREESEFKDLIYGKYVNVLRRFIQNMYPNLKFDICVRDRKEKNRRSDWYGMTYMTLIIYDVIHQPIYNPTSFEPSYMSLGYNGIISFYDFYDTIDSYIPEINKHLLISFEPPRSEHMSTTMMMSNMLQIPDFECWVQYYKRSTIKHYVYPIY